MMDDDIICGTCGKRNDPARVTCWSCRETLEEESTSSFNGKKLILNVALLLALLAVAGLVVPLFLSVSGVGGR